MKNILSSYFGNLTPEAVVVIVLGVALVFLVILLTFLRAKSRPRPKKFRKMWRNLQKKLSSPDNWKDALAEADDLLDLGLRCKKVKGSTFGERIVNGQKYFTDSDAVWYAHKLRKKCQDNSKTKLTKTEIKKALVAIRQGLKDLEAL